MHHVEGLGGNLDAPILSGASDSEKAASQRFFTVTPAPRS
jgi:hypothetical protein